MEILVFLTTMSFSVMVVCQIWTEYLGPFWGKLRIAVCGSWTWIIVNMSGTQVDGCASQCDFCVKKRRRAGGRPGSGAEDCPGPSHRSLTHCWRAACWVAKADGDRLFFLLPFCPQ